MQPGEAAGQRISLTRHFGSATIFSRMPLKRAIRSSKVSWSKKYRLSYIFPIMPRGSSTRQKYIARCTRTLDIGGPVTIPDKGGAEDCPRAADNLSWSGMKLNSVVQKGFDGSKTES